MWRSVRIKKYKYIYKKNTLAKSLGSTELSGEAIALALASDCVNFLFFKHMHAASVVF